MEIVWQTPANPPEPHDYIIRNGEEQMGGQNRRRSLHRGVQGTTARLLRMNPSVPFRSISAIKAINSGRIQVDGELVHASYVVRSSQKISHFVHRHEPPVLAEDVLILQNEADVLTVCKPASVPVHPCGQYRKNTVVGILQAEHGLAPLFPVHRLDRLVSGLLIFAKNADQAEQFRQQIEAGLLQKEYIAKVVGVFPAGEQVVDANVNYNAREGRSSVEVGDQSMGKHLKGKPACTKFTRISTNGTYSVVLCKPVTGRTHQIRVHLQYTGHPIANDMLYLSEDVARSTGRRGAGRAASVMYEPPDSHSSNNDCYAKDNATCSDEEFSIDPMCTNCPNLAPKGYDGDDEALWLHCVRYSGPGWSYECPYPDWASLSGSLGKKIKT
ncbi:RNA pseudouridine synthase 7 isoform X2 [Elaeis guineensis]